MSNRLVKRHKRQVSRAKARLTLSEPDVRTPDEIKAAREASRPANNRRNGAQALYTSSTTRVDSVTPADSPAKAEA